MHQFRDGDYLRAARSALEAAERLRMAIAVPFVEATQPTRKRRFETPLRSEKVSEAGIQFKAKHKRWPKMGRDFDRGQMNAILRTLNSLPFKKDQDFRKWKSEHNISLAW